MFVNTIARTIGIAHSRSLIDRDRQKLITGCIPLRTEPVGFGPWVVRSFVNMSTVCVCVYV